jgi:hypothetical protein
MAADTDARAGPPVDDDDDLEALERALGEVPRGAAALGGAAVGLMMLCWLAIYIFVFLPRGSVG